MPLMLQAGFHGVLFDEVRRHPNITLREKWMAIDLITNRHLKRSGMPSPHGTWPRGAMAFMPGH